jgi:hypothetical protein
LYKISSYSCHKDRVFTNTFILFLLAVFCGEFFVQQTLSNHLVEDTIEMIESELETIILWFGVYSSRKNKNKVSSYDIIWNLINTITDTEKRIQTLRKFLKCCDARHAKDILSILQIILLLSEGEH